MNCDVDSMKLLLVRQLLLFVTIQQEQNCFSFRILSVEHLLYHAVAASIYLQQTHPLFCCCCWALQLTPTGWGYLGGGDNGLGQNAGIRGVAADPCPAGTQKQMLNGDGVPNPGEDPNLLLADYCVPCGPGVFCDPTSATSREVTTQQNCPAGTYGGVIGAKNVAGCIDCPVGTYQDMDGQFECQACGVNTFASAPGSTSCQSCGDGFEVSSSGSNMCNPCKPGWYRDSAVSEKCMECPVGTSSGEGGCQPGLTMPFAA